MRQTNFTRTIPSARPGFLLILLAATIPTVVAQTTNPVPVLQIKADQVAARVSPMLYGLMTEEINFSYEGGLYGELVRNRTFKANPTNAVFWSTVGNGVIALDTNQPLNSALNVSLMLDTRKTEKNAPAGIANDGYWGIPVRPDTTYHASFYARGKGFAGPLTVALTSANGETVLASAEVSKITRKWRKYEVTLKTGAVAPSKDNRLVISTTKRGTIWFSQVSLFPPTFNDRANGNRPDLMQLLADMEPKFLRFPGGNYLEGNTIGTRFNWKETIGDISQRPGHLDDAWGYWSTDGMGLLEFLEWCEDLRMEPLLAVYAGYALHHDYVKPGPDLAPYVQDALDEIEYVTGDTNTRWGAQRAKDGHPAPFPLNYVEVGNEDWFDRSGSYNERFAQFYDAIKAKHPNLQVIATTRVTSREPDLIDEHYYRSQEEMEAQSHMYDTRPRGGSAVTGNVVIGNFIGTDLTGAKAVPNQLTGVILMSGPTNNRIGGTDPGERNIVSGNSVGGVALNGSATGANAVVGNYVGTDPSGALAVPNAGDGINTNLGAFNTLVQGNLSSGNGRYGVNFSDWGTNYNVAVGNRIGTDATGTRSIPNRGGGVALGYGGAQFNRVGGTRAEDRNLVVGGVGVGGQMGTGNLVLGNWIGTDITGQMSLGFPGEGIGLGGDTHSMVGGATPQEANVIAGSGYMAIRVSSDYNYVAGNYIGTDAGGQLRMSNGGSGVTVLDGEHNIIQGNLVTATTKKGTRCRARAAESTPIPAARTPSGATRFTATRARASSTTGGRTAFGTRWRRPSRRSPRRGQPVSPERRVRDARWRSSRTPKTKGGPSRGALWPTPRVRSALPRRTRWLAPT